MRRLAGALFIAFLLVALLPGTAAAIAPPGDLDQSSETGITAYRGFIQPPATAVVGQAFTAGKTGLLTHLELYLDSQGATVTVEVWPTDATGLPTGSSALATTSSILPNFPSGHEWADFVFATPLQVTAGTKYAMLVTDNATYIASWYYTDAYAGGKLFYNLGGGPWTVIDGAAKAFRTYVFQPVVLQWSAASVVAGKSTALTLTETYKLDLFAIPTQVGAQPNAPSPYYVEQVALPSWFAVNTAVCSSQITSPCTPADFVPNAIFSVTPDGNPVTITLTGTASPPAGAAGTKGTASGETCFNPIGTPVCAAGSAAIAILAPGATAPPTTTGGGGRDASDGIPWLLPAALMALLGATFVWRRRDQAAR